MILILVAYLGGILTIISPCILPVLPLVFSSAGQPFRKSGLPLLAGMAATFALFAGLATYTGGWIVRANQAGRWVALVVFAIFGVALLVPAFATWLTGPLVRLGAKFGGTGIGEPSAGRSLLLGVSTGLLWAPCAGPILGLILTGAAVSGPNTRTTLLLLAFAAGAATSLALALLAGGRVFALMKRSLGVEEWIRRGLGVAVLGGVVAIATGVDTGLLRKVSLATTASLEQGLVDRVRPAKGRDVTMRPASLNNEGSFPGFDGAEGWLNSAPLSAAELRGKVVVVDFWTYSCINCLRAIPFVEAWAKKYKDAGLVVVGVHTPEFAFERDTSNVAKAIRELGITYPVAIDNRYAIWNAFHNEYWPAHYFIDANGVIRYHHFGEGKYEESESVIQQLLREAGSTVGSTGAVQVIATGAQASADLSKIGSPETYIGYRRAEHFASPEPVRRDSVERYTSPATLHLNEWSLSGKWMINPEYATLVATAPVTAHDPQLALSAAKGPTTGHDPRPTTGFIRFQFRSRDLHLVLGPSANGKPVRFRIAIDGKAPGASHGMDTDAEGAGEVTSYRLYQLVRQPESAEHLFEIEFLDPGVQAYAFTFG